MATPHALRRIGFCLLLVIAAPPVHSQKPIVLKTERQKYDALEEAKRLSRKAESDQQQGKFNEAERSAERALALEEQVRGPWHIEVAQRLDQIADLYTAHKKDRAAEPLYERARAIRERALSTHPDIYERDGDEIRVKKNQPAPKPKPNSR